MHIRSLKRLIDIVKAMIQPRQITVLGSSSILAVNPDLGENGGPLELSLDADLLIDPCDSKQADILHEAIGVGSLFHGQYGVYADVMKSDIKDTLPSGWEERCIHLDRDRSVRCLSPIDLAIVKLQLGREKDVAILQALLAAGVVSIPALRNAYQRTAMPERTMFKAGRLLRRLETEAQARSPASGKPPPAVGESKPVYAVRAEKRPRPVRRRNGRPPVR